MIPYDGVVDETRPYLPNCYVAIWTYGMDNDGRQYAMLRGRCRLCGWRGPTHDTYDFLHPNKTPEGVAAADEAAVHFAGAHWGRKMDG